MCGRFSFISSKEKVSKQFLVHFGEAALHHSYNIAPTHHAYVITNDQPKALQRFAWGLIPHWVQDSRIGANLINARSETIASKPSFRMPIRKYRCLVLADGFYEWKKTPTGKVPYRILMRDHSILAMAGVWDVWKSPTGLLVHSFAIVTTNANADLAHLHDRMPVIFHTADRQRQWLNEDRLDYALNLLQPLEGGLLHTYPITDKVNKPTYDAPDIHDPRPA